MKQSILQSQIQKSFLKNKGSSKKSSPLSFSLNLTALIDAFSILVIFLLTNMNNGFQNLDLKGGINLPKAQYGEVLGLGTVIKIEKGQFKIEDKLFSEEQLLAKLLEVKKSKPEQAIIIQADQKENYELVSVVIKAAAQAGIEKYMLAILPFKSAGNQ